MRSPFTSFLAHLWFLCKVLVVLAMIVLWRDPFYQHGDGEELKQLWLNAKKYLPDWIVSTNAEFEKILLEPVRHGIAWPFPTLNYMTYGIRTGESYLLTGPEGIGKTEILHAVEHQILRATNDNVGAIFL